MDTLETDRPTLVADAESHDEPTPDTTPDPSDAEPSSEPSTAGELAFAVMRAQYALLRSHESAVERADDPEALHELRVDVRRLREALALFADALPARAAAHRERLDRLGATLGALRDLDVQATLVAGWAGTAPPLERDTLEVVFSVLDERRRSARRRAVAKLTASSARRSFASLERFLTAGPLKRSPVARTPILEIAPELLTHEHRKLAAIGDAIGPDSPPEALHAVRIRCKRLRYGVESFEPWYGKRARAYVKRLAAVQDLLGTHQDAVVAANTLREIGLESDRRLSAAQLLTLGALAERCLERARVLHGSFPGPYARVSGRRWRSLLRAMNEARPARP